MKQKGKKVDVSGGNSNLSFNAFEGLSMDLPLPPGPEQTPVAPASKKTPKKPGMRLEVKREKAGRGGKTVTVVYGVQTIEARIKDTLLKEMKRSFATGGSNTGKTLEIQGDLADRVVSYLKVKGYQAVRAGG